MFSALLGSTVDTPASVYGVIGLHFTHFLRDGDSVSEFPVECRFGLLWEMTSTKCCVFCSVGSMVVFLRQSRELNFTLFFVKLDVEIWTFYVPFVSGSVVREECRKTAFFLRLFPLEFRTSLLRARGLQQSLVGVWVASRVREMCIYWEMRNMFNFSAFDSRYISHVSHGAFLNFTLFPHGGWTSDPAPLVRGNKAFCPCTSYLAVTCSLPEVYLMLGPTVDTHTCVSPRRQPKISVFST